MRALRIAGVRDGPRHSATFIVGHGAPRDAAADPRPAGSADLPDARHPEPERLMPDSCGPAPPLFPEAASTMAGRVDALYFFLLGAHGLLLAADRRPDRLSTRSSTGGARPTASARASTAAWCSRSPGRSSRSSSRMVIFVWGASVFFAMARPPDETLNIYVVGKQWMWKFQHLDGQREINELHVPVGRAGEADHDLRGRDPRRLRPGVPHQGRRHPGPLHDPLVPADQARAATTCSARSTAARGTRG